MALQITNWNLIKKILFIIDITILLLNIILLSFISYILYTEYYYRRTLKLFFAPFILSLFNIIIDIIMNKTNYIMKYAGHNRYGMLIRFFMFYIVIIMIIYADQLVIIETVIWYDREFEFDQIGLEYDLVLDLIIGIELEIM